MNAAITQQILLKLVQYAGDKVALQKPVNPRKEQINVLFCPMFLNFIPGLSNDANTGDIP